MQRRNQEGTAATAVRPTFADSRSTLAQKKVSDRRCRPVAVDWEVQQKSKKKEGETPRLQLHKDPRHAVNWNRASYLIKMQKIIDQSGFFDFYSQGVALCLGPPCARWHRP